MSQKAETFRIFSDHSQMPHLESGCADPEIVFCEPSTKPMPVNYRVESDYYYEGEYAKHDLKSRSAVY